MNEATIHIKFTNYSIVKIRVAYCPTCKARKRAVAAFEDWYGWTETCLGCGDCWTDGEMHERPFARGWRKQSVDSAKRLWERHKATSASS